MKILLIDDDQSLATIFSAALKKDGFETIIAIDATTGLSMAKSEKPGFILLDQVLPDMPGNDVLKQLKVDPETKTIPVAMLSNFGQNELMDQAIQLGALDYILKYQIEPQDLAIKVKQLTTESQNTAPTGTGQ